MKRFFLTGERKKLRRENKFYSKRRACLTDIITTTLQKRKEITQAIPVLQQFKLDNQRLHRQDEQICLKIISIQCLKKKLLKTISLKM